MRDVLVKWINHTISRQLMFAFYMVFIVLSVTSGIVYFYTEQKITQANATFDDLNKRRTNANALASEWSFAQTNVRTYMLTGSKETLESLRANQEEIDRLTKWFEKHAIYEQGKEYAVATRQLYNDYFNQSIPSILDYVDEKRKGEIDEKFINSEILAALSNTQSSLNINRTLSASSREAANRIQMTQIDILLNDYLSLIQEKEANAKHDLLNEMRLSQFIWLSNLVVLILVLVSLIRPFIKRVTKQINVLSRDSALLTEGEDIQNIPLPKRQDELYNLTDTFNHMAKSIADNKVHMLTKNEELQIHQEELIAQQEELQAQQEELEEAFDLTLQNEQRLKYRNELTETLASRETLTAYPEIIEKLVSITHSEIGALLFLDQQEVRSTINYGMSEEMVEQLITSDQSLFHRVRLLKRPMNSSKQVTSESPLPYPYYMYEVAVPVLDPTNQHMIACIYLVRYKNPFNTEQMNDILFFSQQLSLSLMRMGIYEQLIKEKNKTTQILNSIREAVIYLEHETNELLFNEPLMTLLPESLIHDKEEDGSTFHQAMQAFASIIDEPTPFNCFIEQIIDHTLPKDGLVVSIRGYSSFIQIYAEKIEVEGSWVGTMLVLRDVTKETEAERMKEEFVSTVSHELRTPLSSISGFTELMLNKNFEDDRKRKYLQTIHSETGRLTRLVNDFLDVQRMESSEYRYEMMTFDIVEIAQDLIEFYAVSHEAHHIIFEPSPPIMIDGNPEKIKQLLNNLLSNAVKYSPNGGKISIHITRELGFAKIRIQDEGIGISQDAIPKLFNKFYRVDNSETRKIGGTGLGLAICKEIVKYHNGTIDVESVLGIGSTFTIGFPIALTSHTLNTD